MSESLIRPATADDVEDITRIYNYYVTRSTATWDTELHTVEHRAQWFGEREASGQAVLVADVDGVVRGYASWAPFRDKCGYARTMEHTVYVDEVAQGRGLGRALLSELIDRARAAGVHVLLGVVSADNAPSLRLHHSLGFSEVGRLPETGAKFGRWLDLVFLELILSTEAEPGAVRGQAEPVG